MNRKLIAICVGVAMAFPVLAEDVAKDKAKARARAALVLAGPAPVVVADTARSEARIEARAALGVKSDTTKPCGQSCPCEPCECVACACCQAVKVKPMPPATPPPTEKPARVVKPLAYAELEKLVAQLPANEAVRVYAGQKAPTGANGTLYELTDPIPGEAQIVGVWKCWRSGRGELQYASAQPQKGCVRVVQGGRYYDLDPDGSLYWCVECNQGR